MDPDTHARAVTAWRDLRDQRLRSPGGWLTLVDRIVLSPGRNDLPMGTIDLDAGVATFTAHPGAAVTCQGAPVTRRVLPSADGAPPDTLVSGGRSYELFRRGAAFAMRVKDPASPALRAFPGLRHHPIDLRYRLVARFDRYDPPRHTRHQYDIGGDWLRTVPGIARFDLGGQPLALEPVLEAEEDNVRRLFFIFGDLTNQTDTYPAGRFLYAPVPDGDQVVLDFNAAFNPPCAFTPFATCPLTPAQNRLPVAIPAGEKTYLAHPADPDPRP